MKSLWKQYSDCNILFFSYHPHYFAAGRGYSEELTYFSTIENKTKIFLDNIEGAILLIEDSDDYTILLSDFIYPENNYISSYMFAIKNMSYTIGEEEAEGVMIKKKHMEIGL